jgi:hypothetical protein
MHLKAFNGHVTPEVKSAFHTLWLVIYGGMTSQLQVLDFPVNILYSEWLLAVDHILAPTGILKKASVQLL